MSSIGEEEEDQSEEIIVEGETQEDNSDEVEGIIVEEAEEGIDRENVIHDDVDDDVEEVLELPRGFMSSLPETEAVEVLLGKVREFVDNKQSDIEDYQSTLKEYEETLEQRDCSNSKYSEGLVTCVIIKTGRKIEYVILTLSKPCITIGI